MQLVRMGVPIPLGRVDNHRSMLSIENLCDLIRVCLTRPTAQGVFLAADGVDLSTRDLIVRIADSMNRSVIMLPIPDAILRCMGFVPGLSGPLQRLTQSLCVDIEPTREALGWTPPVSQASALAKTLKALTETSQPLGTPPA